MQKPSDPGQQQVETIHTEADIQVTEREIGMSMRRIHLLLEALRASGEKMRPQPIIRKVFVPNDRDAVGVNTISQLMEFQDCSVDHIYIRGWSFATKVRIRGENRGRPQQENMFFFCSLTVLQNQSRKKTV